MIENETTALIKIPRWLAREKQLETSILTVESVKQSTQKAYLVQVHATVRQSQHCHRCGLEITNPVSILVGYGPECSAKLGIPRDFDPDDLTEIQTTVIEQTRMETWLPKSQVTILESNGMFQPEAVRRGKDPTVIEVHDGYIYLRSDYTEKDRCKRITGGQWRKMPGKRNQKAWRYPATPAIAERIAQQFPDPDQADSAYGALLESAQTRTAAQRFKTRETLPDIPNMTYEAWHHQRQAYWFAKDLHATMLAMDMGTGKSYVTVGLIKNREHQRTLILCPKSVLHVWESEFAKHTTGIRCVTLRGSVQEKTQQAVREFQRQERTEQPLVLVCNYTSAIYEPLKTKLTDWQFELVVLDESHKIKAPGGVTSLLCKRIGQRTPYRLCLTGTPMPHSPLDVYAQYRFLDPGIFGTNFHRFKQRYAVMGGYKNKQVLGFQYQDELHEKFYKIAYKVDSDVLDLPETMHIYRSCQLSAKERKVYTGIEREFFAEVDEGEVTVLNALTKLLRMQQVTSGFITNDEGEITRLGTAKRQLLEEVLEGIDQAEPLVIFARFTYDLNLIAEVCESQGYTVGTLSGQGDDLTAWQAGEYDVLAVQIQSGGVGVDFTRARYCIYYSLGFSLGDYEQSLKRIHRPGQEHTIIYIHLLAERSVDEKVYTALQDRKDVVTAILAERNTIYAND